MKLKPTLTVALLLLFLTQGIARAESRQISDPASIEPVDLRCENLSEPIGIAKKNPCLSWVLSARRANTRGQLQKDYQVEVATTTSKLARGAADLWNSGVINSSETLWIAYQGKPLSSSQSVFWRVRVWDERGKSSPWSAAATWTTGIVHSADWHAKWITGPILAPPVHDEQVGSPSLECRRDVFVAKSPSHAILHICGLGQYEFTIDGQKVGKNLLSPGWTNYRKRCLYDSYDVSALLGKGVHALGLLLGNGMYNVVSGRYTKFTGTFGQIKCIAQIVLRFPDNSSQTVGTDSSWREKSGPITFSSPYGGEDYDARMESPGWDHPGFNDSSWSQCNETTGPGGTLMGADASAPPILPFETLKPVRIFRLSDKSTIYDMGQNASLMPQVEIAGTQGSTVKITPAELLNPDGSLDRRSAGGGEAYWQYTIGRSRVTTYIPKFFYHGSRYLKVDCSSPIGQPVPTIKSLIARVVHSDSHEVGTFASSNDLFNRVNGLIQWAQKSNLVSVITDCPHRERLGWLEQTHLNGPALRYNYDLTNLFAKVENDMEDSQLDNGCVPDIAPEFVNFSGHAEDVSNPFRDSAEWGSAFLLVPLQQYEFSGDPRPVQTHYAQMKRYVDFLQNQAKGGIVDFGLGDWYDIGPNAPGFSQLTPRAFTATAFYYADTVALSKFASTLGRKAEAKALTERAANIRAALNQKFYNPETASYATGSQCANGMALFMDLPPPTDRSRVLGALVHDVEAKGLTAGDVGYRFLIRALADGGRSDVILKMNNQSDRPGYGYQLKKGATSLTEAWDANPTSSQNHFMLGQIMEWFYHDVAGIQCAPEEPGFRRIVIRPAISCGLKSARATYRSLRGEIASSWAIRGNRLELDIKVPPNTTATVYLPSSVQTAMRESQAPLEKNPNVRLSSFGNHVAEIKTSSGHFHFTSQI